MLIDVGMKNKQPSRNPQPESIENLQLALTGPESIEYNMQPHENLRM